MKLLAWLVHVALAILALRGIRWAYVTFVLMGLLYFPVSVGFKLNPRPCELAPGFQLAIHSLTNYAHIVMFAIFFVITSAQLRMSRWTGYAWAALATIVMGALVEISQGVTGNGHCRLRDLIPDTAGILIGAAVVLLWNRLRRRQRAD